MPSPEAHSPGFLPGRETDRITVQTAGPWDSDALGSQSFMTPSHEQELAHFFFFFLIHLLFMYLLWLCWVFIAMGAFSSYSDWGLVSCYGSWASPCGIFPCCRAQALSSPAQTFEDTDFVAIPDVGSSGTRDQTPVPCIGRWILNHWTTREGPTVLYLRYRVNAHITIMWWL